MEYTANDIKNSIKEYKYSDQTIKTYTSYIIRACPISRLSVEDYEEIVRLLAEVLKLLGINDSQRTGDIKASIHTEDKCFREIIVLMASEINSAYKDADVSSAVSTKIMTYLSVVLGTIFDHFPVPFTYKDVTYDFAEKDDDVEIENIINLLADTFSKEDKQVCLELSYDEVRPYMALHVQEEVKEKNIMVARDEAGKMLGVMTWQDFCKDVDAFREMVTPKYGPNFSLYKILQDKFKEFYPKVMGEEIMPGDVIYYRAGAVNRLLMEKVLNRDIGNMMYLFSTFITYSRGYIAGCGVDTNEISQYLAKKYGGLALDNIEYDDFIIDGRKPFENLYAKTPKKDSIYKRITSIIGFMEPYHMELARNLINERSGLIYSGIRNKGNKDDIVHANVGREPRVLQLS